MMAICSFTIFSQPMVWGGQGTAGDQQHKGGKRDLWNNVLTRTPQECRYSMIRLKVRGNHVEMRKLSRTLAKTDALTGDYSLHLGKCYTRKVYASHTRGRKTASFSQQAIGRTGAADPDTREGATSEDGEVLHYWLLAGIGNCDARPHHPLAGLGNYSCGGQPRHQSRLLGALLGSVTPCMNVVMRA